jgi:biopolymer transport protein ExbD
MAVKINRGNALVALNLTAMIDVVMLLLIYFMVASRLSEDERTLDIPLPSAANAMPMTAEPSELVVNIDELGNFIVDDQVIKPADLDALITRAVVDNPLRPAVIIRADRRVPTQSPVSVMDVCIKCGAAYSLSIADEEQ